MGIMEKEMLNLQSEVLSYKREGQAILGNRGYIPKIFKDIRCMENFATK